MYKTGTWGIQAKQRHKRRRAQLQRARFFDRHGRYPEGDESYEKTSSLGYYGELLAIKVLGDAQRAGRRLPTHDIEWKGKRVEVKTSVLHKQHPNRSKSESWNFFIGKKQRGADLILFLCLDKDKRLVKSLLLKPSDIQTHHFYLSKEVQ